MTKAPGVGFAGLGLLFAIVAVGPATAGTGDAGGMCDARNESVLLVLVQSPEQVRAAAAGLSKADMLVNESNTVIFTDARVVTSDLAAASEHLNRLGWATRKIEIAGAGTSTRLRPAIPGRRRG